MTLLTPMLNVGLFSPRQIIEATLAHAERFLAQLDAWNKAT